MSSLPRVVITGVGLTSPNGDSLQAYRKNLLEGVSGVERYHIRHVGETSAGVCHYDPLKYQRRKELRRGTRAGSIAIWSAREALADANLDLDRYGRSRVGVYVDESGGAGDNELYVGTAPGGPAFLTGTFQERDR